MHGRVAEDWKGGKQARRRGDRRRTRREGGGWRRTGREGSRRGEKGQADKGVGCVRQTKHDEWRGWRSDLQIGLLVGLFVQGGNPRGRRRKEVEGEKQPRRWQVAKKRTHYYVEEKGWR